MSALVERLRAQALDRYAPNALLREAADKIERLRSALKPFADCCEQINADEDDEEWAKFRLLIKNYRHARDAMEET